MPLLWSDSTSHSLKTQEEVIVLARHVWHFVAAHIRKASRARSDAELVSKLGGAIQEAEQIPTLVRTSPWECSIAAALTKPLETEASELAAICPSTITELGARRLTSPSGFRAFLCDFSFSPAVL